VIDAQDLAEAPQPTPIVTAAEESVTQPRRRRSKSPRAEVAASEPAEQPPQPDATPDGAAALAAFPD
jgi:hypothetical protein